MGIFADLQPKLNVGLLEQIQRHKLDFSSRPATPVTASVSPTRRMQIACESPELADLYENEATHEDRTGVDLFFKKDTVIPSGRRFMIPLGVTCRLVPSHQDLSPLAQMPWMLVPKQELGASPLRMATSIGVMDGGFRGELFVCVDNCDKKPFIVKKGMAMFHCPM